MKNAVVFSGGTVTDYSFIKQYLTDDIYVICADSGIIHCNKLGIKADMVVGDYDSVDSNSLCSFRACKDAKIVTLNPCKDNTDTEYAIDCAVDKGCREVILIGGIGTRLDHTLANIFLMEKYLKKGVVLTVINENNILHFVSSAEIIVKKSPMKYISVIPLDSAVRVTTKGFKYPLCNELLSRDSSRGISNEIIEDIGLIEVVDGCALVAETVD